MKFYPFLVIAESQKGWYFFVELSSVNIIWNVPNLNLQKSHKNKAKLWFNILLSFFTNPDGSLTIAKAISAGKCF